MISMNVISETVAPELKLIKVVSPWHIIGVDLIGPFTKSRNSNSWCLTAIPINVSKGSDETGEATSKVMVDIFNTHGSPEAILSDRGHERWNKVW
ncbi:hypothetical protein J4Q44_G00111450 [Coregonus suidteri]|uniref:Uncharacterized protein n=1 Tax=Coregonus suidteri TaxID=861788 RepID=A0AAN8QVY3_9TELE